MNQGNFLRSESRQTVAENLLHVFGVVAEVDWVGVPTDVEVESVLTRGGIYT